MCSWGTAAWSARFPSVHFPTKGAEGQSLTSFSFECARSEPAAISWFRSRWNQAARGPSVHFLRECYRSPRGVSAGARNRSTGSTFAEVNRRENARERKRNLVMIFPLLVSLRVSPRSLSRLAVFLIFVWIALAVLFPLCIFHPLFIRYQIKTKFDRERRDSRYINPFTSTEQIDYRSSTALPIFVW